MQPDANGEVQAADADLRLQSAFGGVDDHFGLRVAPLFDVTENGLPEIRVRALVREEHVDFIGGTELMHVFAGADSEYAEAGEFLFAIAVNDEFDPWQPLPGDVTGDGAVTQDDIDIILANMGLEGSDLTIADGDLNGDGVVDALDLAIALDHLGTHLLDVNWEEGGVPTVFGMDGQPASSWQSREEVNPGICFDQFGIPLCCTPCIACPACCCGGGQGGIGTGDPCIDEGPCHPECEDRWCNPACGAGHGECHAQCSGSECNDACDHFDPCNEECGDDGDGGSYGPCHPDCEGWECNPDCEGADPCDEACEGDGGGPCGENCDERFCDEECCDENDPDCDYGTCHEECDERFCDVDCYPDDDSECSIEVCCRSVLGTSKQHCFVKCNLDLPGPLSSWACGGREGSKRGRVRSPGARGAPPNTAPDCPGFGSGHPIETYCGPFLEGNPEYDNANGGGFPAGHVCRSMATDCGEAAVTCMGCLSDVMKDIQDCCIRYRRPIVLPPAHGGGPVYYDPNPCHNSNSSARTALMTCVQNAAPLADCIDDIVDAPCWDTTLDLSNCP